MLAEYLTLCTLSVSFILSRRFRTDGWSQLDLRHDRTNFERWIALPFRCPSQRQEDTDLTVRVVDSEICNSGRCDND